MPTISLQQLNADGGGGETKPRRRYARWRVGSLIGVHVLVALHIAHWRISGKTLAPLELNEVMYTLELGIVTAGFILMALAILSVAVFGRFFCSWGCHILALQDLCGWILGKLRIRTKPVRSRVLLFVAPGAMLYMFVWPHVERLIDGRPLPRFHLRDDSGGWASFVTDDFWRNLPGPGVALMTFAICGFVIVYFLGTRSFCQYACPYGAIFGIMDRIAPGRIKVDPDKCIACGVCTGVCESHVRVHEEIAQHGSVVDPSCLKDLDCVTACPEQALSFGWTRPSLLRSFRPARRRLRYDFSLGEDVLMAAVFLVTLAVFRGLYGIVPFLLTLALGGILGYVAVLCVRLPRRDNVRLNGFQLKFKGKTTRTGRVFSACSLLLLVFVVHSGMIRYHEITGDRALENAAAMFGRGETLESVRAASRDALVSLRFCERWGLLIVPDHHRKVASACWGAGDIEGAENAWRSAIKASSGDMESRLELVTSLLQRGRPELAEPLLREVCDDIASPARDAHLYAEALYNLGVIEEYLDRREDAIGRYRESTQLNPDDPDVWSNLGRALWIVGEPVEAKSCLEQALRVNPSHANAHFNLGRLLVEGGLEAEGLSHLRRAAELNPQFLQYQQLDQE